MGKSRIAGVTLVVLLIGLLAGCMSVPTHRHPNLDSARQYAAQAIERLTAAQQANDLDMNGHAAKAKQLIEQAISEINLAEQAADAK